MNDTPNDDSTDTRRVRIRLGEVLDDVRTLDGQLPEPLSLTDSIDELEDTIDTADRFERAIEHVDETREAYDRLEDDDG